MAKSIPKIGSRKRVCIGLRRNAHFSLWKSARRITRGVIHVQASFNNTIITVTDLGLRTIINQFTPRIFCLKQDTVDIIAPVNN